MQYYKQYIIIIIIYLTYVGALVNAREALMTVEPAAQSANSVVINDCNLSITNPELLQEIHGQTPTTSLSANDIITAHKKTMEVCKWVSSKNPNQPRTTSMIENLCTLAIAKLEGKAEEISDRPSFALAKTLKKLLVTDRVKSEWLVPTTVSTQLKKTLGPIITLMSYTSPEKCGTINMSNNQWIGTLYTNMSDSIYNIITDCGASIPYSTRWMQTRISMLASTTQTPYVFGFQQWGNHIDMERQRCQTRLSLSYQKLLNEAQISSIKAQNNYNLNNTRQRFINIAEQSTLQKEVFTKTLSASQMTAQDTPTTAKCN
jgi:hypothetical protein